MVGIRGGVPDCRRVSRRAKSCKVKNSHHFDHSKNSTREDTTVKKKRKAGKWGADELREDRAGGRSAGRAACPALRRPLLGSWKLEPGHGGEHQDEASAGMERAAEALCLRVGHRGEAPRGKSCCGLHGDYCWSGALLGRRRLLASWERSPGFM